MPARRCAPAAPSGGAFRWLKKKRTAIGTALVDSEHCLLGWDQECSVCQNRCPYEAIRIQFDEVEYFSLPKVDPEKCTGCGACQVACPTTPKSMFVVPEATPIIVPVADSE